MAGTPEQNAWIKRVLSLVVEPGAAPAEIPEVGIPDTEDPFNLDERLGIVRADLLKLKAAQAPGVAEIEAQLTGIAKSVKDKSSSAPADMEALEEELWQATLAMKARSIETETRIPLGFRKLLIDWHAAQGAVEQNLRALGDAYLDNEEVQADPRFDEVFEAVRALPALIPAFGDQLDTDVNAILNDGGRDKALTEAGIKTIGRYRATLQSASMLADLEKVAANDLGQKAGLYSMLENTINQIESQMKELRAA